MRISYTLTGILTLNNTVSTIICRVFIAPQSSWSKFAKKNERKMFEVAKPSSTALAPSLTRSIAYLVAGVVSL